MKFRTVNDLKTIQINEMNLTSIKLADNTLSLALEGAVIKADNPNNNRYQDVYCTQMELVFTQVQLRGFCLQGFKYYDADGRLLNEVPSRTLTDEERAAALDLPSGAWVFALECCDPDQKLYRLIYDVDDDDSTKTYELEFTFGGSTATWERFAGPVEG